MDNFTVWPLIGSAVIITALIVETLHRIWMTSKGEKKIPYMTPLPILGNFLLYSKIKNVQELYDNQRKYFTGIPLVGVWIGPKLFIYINEAKYIDTLIAKPSVSQKPEEMYSRFDLMFKGVFTTRDTVKWAKLRKSVNEFLKKSRVDNWIDIFSEKAVKLNDKIAQQSGPFELEPLIFYNSISTLSETQLGAEEENTLFNEEGYCEAFRNALDVGPACMFMRLLDFIYRVDFIYYLSTNWKILKRNIDIATKPMSKLLNDRRKLLESTKVDISMTEPESYVDTIIKMAVDEKLSNEEMLKIGMDFFTAGTETTASAITSTIAYLAMYPHYQLKVYQELQQVFGDSDKNPKLNDINKLEFLEMVINENLRLAGPATITRSVTKDVHIDGYVIPKNSIVSFVYMNAWRDEKYWEKPYQFYPEHFLPEAVATRPKGVFAPFSGGLRSCPGKDYAMISVKVALSTVLRKFEFTTDIKFEDLKYKMAFMQAPSGLIVQAQRRRVT